MKSDAIKEHYKDGEASEYLCPTCKTILDYDKTGDFMYCEKCGEAYNMDGSYLGLFPRHSEDREDR